MHGGDDRLLGAEQPHGFLVEVVGRLAADRRALLLAFRIVEIGAGAERFALGAENHRADAVVLVELLHRRRDLLDQLHVEEVVRRPLDLDLADEVRGLGDADILVSGHANSLVCLS
jgi:hypothetical protein